MKQECDNNCNTCLDSNRIFCALSYSKANNALLNEIYLLIKKENEIIQPTINKENNYDNN